MLARRRAAGSHSRQRGAASPPARVAAATSTLRPPSCDTHARWAPHYEEAQHAQKVRPTPKEHPRDFARQARGTPDLAAPRAATRAKDGHNDNGHKMFPEHSAGGEARTEDIAGASAQARPTRYSTSAKGRSGTTCGEAPARVGIAATIYYRELHELPPPLAAPQRDDTRDRVAERKKEGKRRRTNASPDSRAFSSRPIRLKANEPALLPVAPKMCAGQSGRAPK
ncbi:hypothetical protein C8J57DRAFT_1230531 [Mycena rebaudengoi]|nr:hypothetical protein C8J57DRAFT_1230531 [Mycena rebaudengoi]